MWLKNGTSHIPVSSVSIKVVRPTQQIIDVVKVFDAILTSRPMCEKLQCLYENLMSNNFLKIAVLKKNKTGKLKLKNKGLC